MTTIAFQNKTLAADGRVTCDGKILSDNYNKIIKINKEVRFLNGKRFVKYMANAGIAIANEAVYNFLVNDKEIDYIDSMDFTTFILTDEDCYIMHVNDDGAIIDRCIGCEAIGSGADFAMSAMKLGLSAAEAVKHAAKIDVLTGGKIKKVKI